MRTALAKGGERSARAADPAPPAPIAGGRAATLVEAAIVDLALDGGSAASAPALDERAAGIITVIDVR
jgi:hypothetical protein